MRFGVYLRKRSGFSHYTACFVHYTACFVRYSACFVHYTVCFVRYTACFIRYSACFVRYTAAACCYFYSWACPIIGKSTIAWAHYLRRLVLNKYQTAAESDSGSSALRYATEAAHTAFPDPRSCSKAPSYWTIPAGWKAASDSHSGHSQVLGSLSW